MKVWLVFVATWIWWAIFVGPAAWVCSSSLSVMGGGNNAPTIHTKDFRVTGCTKNSYSVFLESLRTKLSSGTSVHDIPLLPAQSGSRQDLLLVKLFDLDDEPITLVLNMINVYVIAYQAKNRYYLLADTPDNPYYDNKPLSKPHRLSFTGTYRDLERVAGSREKIPLGINELGSAISNLYRWSPPQVERTVARSLLVLIQMVSEASRFRAIEQRVKNNIIDDRIPIRYDSFSPGVGVMSLQNNWGALSTAVQQSIQGVFLQPVKLQVSNSETIDIKDAKTARTYCGLALLLYWRKSQASLSPYDSSVLSTSLDLNIRYMLDIAV